MLPSVDKAALSDLNSWSHEQHLAHDLYAFFSVPVHWRVFLELVGQRPPKCSLPPDIRSFFCTSVPQPTDMPVYQQTNATHDEPTFELSGRPPDERSAHKSSSVSALGMMSLNLLNFLCTNYCTLVCVNYLPDHYAALDELFLSEQEFCQRADERELQQQPPQKPFILKSDYDSKLEVYCKKHFDPYAREPNVLIGGVVSSLKQLNYLRWAIDNRVVSYACHHRAEIASFKYCLHRNPKAKRDEPIKLIQKKYTRKRSAAIVKHFNERLASREQVQYIFYS